MLRHDGQLHWEPGGIFKTTCDIDIAYFPFDTQHCPIVVGAYSYYSTRMNITNVKSIVSCFAAFLTKVYESIALISRGDASAMSFADYDRNSIDTPLKSIDYNTVV